MYRNGDIAFWHEHGVVFDVGIILAQDNTPKVMRIRPLQGLTIETLPTDFNHLAIYRYIGRKDDPRDDIEVAKEAAFKFKQWNKYRYLTNILIILSRLPILCHWLSASCDVTKVNANKGFTSSTGIAWAYECVGVDLCPNLNPDLVSVGDLARCALLNKIS